MGQVSLAISDGVRAQSRCSQSAATPTIAPATNAAGTLRGSSGVAVLVPVDLCNAAAAMRRRMWSMTRALLPAGELAGKTVIDTLNYYPQRDGRIAELDSNQLTSSQLVQQHLADSHVVKAFNSITYISLANRARPTGDPDRSALPIAGDDTAAKAQVTALLDTLGYDAVDIGTLADSRRSEPNTPVYVQPYFAGEPPKDLESEHARRWHLTNPGAPVTSPAGPSSPAQGQESAAPPPSSRPPRVYGQLTAYAGWCCPASGPTRPPPEPRGDHGMEMRTSGQGLRVSALGLGCIAGAVSPDTDADMAAFSEAATRLGVAGARYHETMQRLTGR